MSEVLSKPFATFFKRWLFWIGVALLHAIMVYTTQRSEEQKAPFVVWLGWDLVHVHAWFLLMPVIMRVVRAFPFAGGPRRIFQAIGAHAIAAPLIVLVHSSLCSAFFLTDLIPRADPERDTFTAMMQFYLVRRTLYHTLLYAIMVSVTMLFDMRKRFREEQLLAERLRREATEARLQALHAKLHPHFLFNTLHAISVLVTEDPNRAVDMLALVGDLLRDALKQSDHLELPLQEELGLIERYLAIEEMRFEDALKVEYEIDPATRDLSVPSFILQPLVENAIRHGIAHRNGPGLLVIRSQLIDGAKTLRLEVTDNGPGFVPVPSDERGGIGIPNTRDRLESLYGVDQASLSLQRTATGTTVTILLPARATATAIAPVEAERTEPTPAVSLSTSLAPRTT